MSEPPHELRGESLCVQRGPKEVLRHVDVELRSSEVVAVIGPNGAGKSTLIKALTGLVPLTSGRVCINGDDAARMSPKDRARSVAYVPQRTQLRSALRVIEVVAQARFAHDDSSKPAQANKLRAAMEALQIEGFSERPFTQLSVGEQQRVMIARAVATDASYLLLDEPAAALDIGQALSTYATLRRLASEGRGVVVVLHSIDDARRFADRCVVIADGQIVASGPPDATIDDTLLSRIYGVRRTERSVWSFETEPGS